MSNGLRRLRNLRSGVSVPQSGLDLFLGEASKYISPEYQAGLRAEQRAQEQSQIDNQRADARLKLQEMQFNEDNKRYLDSVNQQNIINESNQKNYELEKSKFDEQKKINARAEAKEAIESSLSVYAGDITGMANLNPDIILASIDPELRGNFAGLVNSKIESAQRVIKKAEIFADTHNFNNPDNLITKTLAIDLIKDPKSYQQYIYNHAIKEKPELSELDEKKLSVLTNQISSQYKSLTNLLESYDPEMASEEVSSEIQTLRADIAKNQLSVSNILNPGSSGDIAKDSMAGTGSGDNQTTPSFAQELSFMPPMDRTPVPFAPQDDDYDIVFNQDDDAVENALSAAGTQEEMESNIQGEDVDDVSVLDNIISNISGVTAQPAVQGNKEGMPEEMITLPMGEKIDGDNLQDIPRVFEEGKEVRGLERNSGFKTPEGKFRNMEGVTSDISKSLKQIERVKTNYQNTEPSNKKTLLARQLTRIQKDMLDLLSPYLSDNMKLKDSESTNKFYGMLSKKSGISESELKRLLKFNMGFNI